MPVFQERLPLLRDPLVTAAAAMEPQVKMVASELTWVGRTRPMQEGVAERIHCQTRPDAKRPWLQLRRQQQRKRKKMILAQTTQSGEVLQVVGQWPQGVAEA
jgi:hypothetical protein